MPERKEALIDLHRGRSICRQGAKATQSVRICSGGLYYTGKLDDNDGSPVVEALNVLRAGCRIGLADRSWKCRENQKIVAVLDTAPCRRKTCDKSCVLPSRPALFSGLVVFPSCRSLPALRGGSWCFEALGLSNSSTVCSSVVT